jgi:O-6-methylguanine DNA methyltransferase
MNIFNPIIMTIDELDDHLKHNEQFDYFFETPAGILKVFATKFGIFKAEFTNELIPSSECLLHTTNNLLISGTQFQSNVLQATLSIPKGIRKNYFELAEQIGQPKAYRAVANALAQNKIAYFIPCHRIIRKDGKLGGYKWGANFKAKILENELI